MVIATQWVAMVGCLGMASVWLRLFAFLPCNLLRHSKVNLRKALAETVVHDGVVAVTKLEATSCNNVSLFWWRKRVVKELSLVDMLLELALHAHFHAGNLLRVVDVANLLGCCRWNSFELVQPVVDSAICNRMSHSAIPVVVNDRADKFID